MLEATAGLAFRSVLDGLGPPRLITGVRYIESMDLQDFEGVTKVTFKKWNPTTRLWRKWFTVSDPGNVRRLLSVIRLKPFGSGPRPGCIHELVASFQKDSGESFDVDFCMACFGECCMPKELYDEFQRLARRHRRYVAILCSALVLGALAILLAAIRWNETS